MRCVRTVAWRRQSYSATIPFSRDPLQPLIHTSPPAAPGLGRPDVHRVLKPCCCTFPARTWTRAASPPQGEANLTRLPNPRRNQTQISIKKKKLNPKPRQFPHKYGNVALPLSAVCLVEGAGESPSGVAKPRAYTPPTSGLHSNSQQQLPLPST